MTLLPYPARPFQDVAVKMAAQAAADGGHLVLEMPTGSGKTVVLLAGALEAALRTGKRILYVSRTHSQQEQTIKEFNAICAKGGIDARAFALQGRAKLCLKLDENRDPEWSDATPEELSHFCSSAKGATDRDRSSPRACRFWGNLREKTDDELRSWLGPQARTADWLRAASYDQGICPYELVKRMLPAATLVVAPYVFALDAGLRRRLLEWWGCTEKDVILIVDEAHNIPPYLREAFSPRLTREGLRRALLEVQELGSPLVGRAVPGREFLEGLATELDRIVNEYCKEEDGFIPPFELETALLERFTVTTRGLAEIAGAMAALGEAIRDRRKLMGRIPRSHLAHVSSFLNGWLDSDEEGYAKLAGREPRRYLEAFLVDTARLSERFTSFHASLHASGTLDPLDEYRASLGLPDGTRMERFPSPYPADALQIHCVEGVTTRHESITQDPTAMDRLQETTRQCLEHVRVKSACFLPSHRLLGDFEEVGVFQGLPVHPNIERADLSSAALAALLEHHRKSPSSLLVGVLGGRLSEGLDFPGRELEALIVVGLPFPKPSAHQRALFHYHEVRHGRGWDFAVRAPTLRRIRQALGRLIRGPDDRGFALILDERAGPFLRSAGIETVTAPLDRAMSAFDGWQQERSIASAISLSRAPG